jgi:hypothetical protein
MSYCCVAAGFFDTDSEWDVLWVGLVERCLFDEEEGLLSTKTLFEAFVTWIVFFVVADEFTGRLGCPVVNEMFDCVLFPDAPMSFLACASTSLND